MNCISMQGSKMVIGESSCGRDESAPQCRVLKDLVKKKKQNPIYLNRSYIISISLTERYLLFEKTLEVNKGKILNEKGIWRCGAQFTSRVFG
jgi:hypothetical protein